MHLRPFTTYSKQAPRRLHAMSLGLKARSGRTCLVCRSRQLGADDERCVVLASKWFVLWVGEINYSIGGPARTAVLQLTLSKSVIQYLLALGRFEGHMKGISSRELFVRNRTEVAVVFCVFSARHGQIFGRHD